MLGPNTTSNQLRPGRSSFEEVAMEARREAAGQLLDVEAPASSASCPQTAPARLLRSEVEPLPGLKGRRNRQQLRRTRRREHEVVDTMISPEEYEALPPSIRKKYFSTHERLQIAQHAAANRRKRQSVKKTWLDSSSSESRPRPKSVHRPFAQSPRRTSRLTATQEHVTENEALWFLSLPEKVKRQQFSREEQAVLTERCESKLRSGSPESAEELYRRRLTISREEGSSCVPRRRSSLPTSTVLDEETLAALAAAEPKSLRSVELEDDDEMAIFRSRSRRQSFATSLISLPPPPASPAFVELKQERKRTFRRSFSLKPLPLPPPTLTPVPALPSPSSIHHLDKPSKLRRSKTDPVFEHRELPADAKYILDPETRKALRNFASPQMFDETIHFGFPSAEPDLPTLTETPGSDHIRDYSLTFSSSEDEDSTSAHSPVTPTHHGGFTEPAVVRNISSADSDPAMPLQQIMSFGGKTPDYRRSPSFGQREPTLRMTLTRPDLRAPENELYGWQKPETNEDPLALASLPVCDDPTGAHGAFAVQEIGTSQVKGIKKVWKTLIRQ